MDTPADRTEKELQVEVLRAAVSYFDSGKIGAFSAPAAAAELGVEVGDAIRAMRVLKANNLVDYYNSNDPATSMITSVPKAGREFLEAQS